MVVMGEIAHHEQFTFGHNVFQSRLLRQNASAGGIGLINASLSVSVVKRLILFHPYLSLEVSNVDFCLYEVC